MTTTRTIAAILPTQPTLEGAGVHLRRGFGNSQENLFDPFLLFDDFSGDSPEKFMKGFPWHPHRGIETITYLLEGDVEHGDSMGNQGVIHPGDVQWMTAGRGVIHQEMPQESPAGRLVGFQLWANLPASHKMIPPRYRGITADEIPEVEMGGAHIRVICGAVGGVAGPALDIIIEPEYLDVTLQPRVSWTHAIPAGYTAFAYFFHGSVSFEPGKEEISASAGKIVRFGDGDQVVVQGGEQAARFLLISGKPLGEPIAWGGPIVMNTQAELRQAFAEIRGGTFINGGDRMIHGTTPSGID